MQLVLIASLILAGLGLVGYYLAQKGKRKIVAVVFAVFNAVLIFYGIAGDIDFFAIFIWLFLFAVQLVFISYWILRLANQKKLAAFFSLLLAFSFVILAAWPWISDWTFSKQDVRELLQNQNVYLEDEFELTENASGGLRDYYHTMILSISENDKERLINNIRKAKNFKTENEIDYMNMWKGVNQFDTLNYETKFQFIKEYYLEDAQEDGVTHYRFQLSKPDNELIVVGSDE